MKIMASHRCERDRPEHDVKLLSYNQPKNLLLSHSIRIATIILLLLSRVISTGFLFR